MKCAIISTNVKTITESVLKRNCSPYRVQIVRKRGDTMTRGEIWKDFFKKTVLPAVIALFLFSMFKNVFTENGETNYFYIWLCCGIPFGIRRMFVWLVPHGYDLGGTVGIVALNFILGGLIGGVILIWRLVCAAWYIPLTVYRLLTIGKGGMTEIKVDE